MLCSLLSSVAQRVNRFRSTSGTPSCSQTVATEGRCASVSALLVTMASSLVTCVRLSGGPGAGPSATRRRYLVEGAHLRLWADVIADVGPDAGSRGCE